MIEIMVSVALVGIATAFVFSIQIKMSAALRDQQTVSETQQTLRSASELILRDLRMSGYLAQQVAVVPAPGVSPWTVSPIGPVSVANGGVDLAPDQILILYADTSAAAPINSNFVVLPLIANGPDAYYNPAGTYVSTVAGFATGDRVLLTHAGIGAVTGIGIGCILGVTGVTAPNVIKTDPAGGAPWNTPSNAHCTGVPNFTTFFDDGQTEFTKVVIRSYRIRPGDPRGVLEMSPSGGRVAGDYQALALGIVDMQIALRIGTPATGTILAGACATDADAHHDWVSSDNMSGPFVADARVVEVSLTLLAKTTKEVQGVTITQTPDLFDGDLAHRACNHVGDVTGTPLPVTASTSPYFGEHAYRTYTATVDLRNANVPN